MTRHRLQKGQRHGKHGRSTPGMRGFDNISLTAPTGSEFSGDAGQTTRVPFQPGKLYVFDQQSRTRL
jgi:hypothetical protein